MLASSRGKRKGRKCPRGFFAGCRIPARPVVAPKDGAGLAVLLRVDLAMTMANGISLSLSLSLSFFRYISAEQCHIPKLLPHHTYRDTQHHPYRGTRHLRYVQEHRSTRAHEDERARTASHRERERAQGLQRPREGGGGGGGGGTRVPRKPTWSHQEHSFCILSVLFLGNFLLPIYRHRHGHRPRRDTPSSLSFSLSFCFSFSCSLSSLLPLIFFTIIS